MTNLGIAYAALGDARKAIEFYEQALVIDREIGDRRGEGNALGNLGAAYADLGDARKAIEFYEQALVIDREIGSKQGEGTRLSNLAGQYSSLAEYDKSVDYYTQALQNAREIGNRYGESKRLNGLAGVLIEKGDLQNAIINSQEALRIGQEMSSPEVCIESGNTLATALLFSEKFIDALQVVHEAEKCDRPSYIFNVSALHGIIALRQGEEVAARGAFLRAIG
jgi:tetratricopeptide (TPR) repeat protein